MFYAFLHWLDIYVLDCSFRPLCSYLAQFEPEEHEWLIG